MIIPQTAYYIFLLSCFLTGVIGHLHSSPLIWIPIISIMTFLWWFSNRKSWAWMSGICFLFFVYLAIKMSSPENSILTPLIEMFSALYCWDIALLNHRLRLVNQVVDIDKTVGRYFIGMAIVFIVSLISVVIAVNLKIGIGFIWIIVISLVAVVAISRMGKLSIRQD